MSKQAYKACFGLFIVLSMLAGCSFSAKPSEHIAPTASESENNATSSESYVSVPPSANIPDVKTESKGTLPQENVSTPPTSANIPDVKTESNGTLSGENVSTPPSANIPDVKTESDGTLSRENVSTPSSATKSIADHQLAPSPSVYTKNVPTSPSLSPSPSLVDNSVLNPKDMDSVSQQSTSVPPPKADPPAAETQNSSIGDLSQENTSLPPSPTVEANQEVNALVPASSLPSLPPAYTNTPAFESSDGGSFTQENITPPPSNIVSSESPKIVPQLNDYSSLPNDVAPTPSQALSYPQLDPTIQLTPSNDDTFNSAPTSDNQHTILPSNYRAEDEPVEPYEEEEDSWDGVNGAVAGVIGACVIGVGGFVYQKRKKDHVRAQYQSLGKKDDV